MGRYSQVFTLELQAAADKVWAALKAAIEGTTPHYRRLSGRQFDR